MPMFRSTACILTRSGTALPRKHSSAAAARAASVGSKLVDLGVERSAVVAADEVPTPALAGRAVKEAPAARRHVCMHTEPAPADSPKIVTLPGSPPNAACVRTNAARGAGRANPWLPTGDPSCESDGCAKKPSTTRR